MPHNPFQAPVHADEHSGLAPDTEFLVSDKCVLSEDPAELPHVCILTGKRGDLIQQSATLRWSPPFLTRLFVFLLVFLCPAIGLSLARMSSLTVAGTAQPISETVIPVILMLGVIGLTGFVWWLTFRLTKKVRVTWHVDAEAIRQRKAISRLWRLGAFVAGMVVVGLILLAVFVDSDFATFIMGPLLAGAICLGRSHQKHRPILSGQHNGLNVLTGLSPLFLQEVQAMIERHNSRA